MCVCLTTELWKALQSGHKCISPTETLYFLHYIKFVTFTAAPISIMPLSRYDGAVFTINCPTTGSPATTVEWAKDSTQLKNDDTYQIVQELEDGTTATYNNLLLVSGEPDEVIGTYSCSASNEIVPTKVTVTQAFSG